MRRAITILLLIIAVQVQSQDKVPHSIKMDFKLPTPMGNGAYRGTNDGISDASLTYTYPFKFGLTIGAGLSHMYTEVNEFSLNVGNNIINGDVQRWGFFGELGYESYISDQGFFDFGIRAGYATFYMTSNYCDARGIKAVTDQGYYIEPYLGVHMFAKDNFTIGLIVSYGIADHEFSPASLCMDSFSGYAQEAYSGVNQNFSVGFGFSAFLREGRR